MASLPYLRLARRPVLGRLVLVHRVPLERAGTLLPDGLRPRAFGNEALIVHCYSRLGTLRSRFLAARSRPSHHVSYRVAAEDPASGTPLAFVVRRETSSRLDARWNETVLRRQHRRASFELEKDPFRVRLRVSSPDREELFVHAELSERAGELFPTPRAVAEFLESCAQVRPIDSLAPEADAIDLERCFAPEPLEVIEFRSAFLADHFGPDEVRLDGAWRLATKRVAPVRTPMRPRRRTIVSPGGLPA